MVINSSFCLPLQNETNLEKGKIKRIYSLSKPTDKEKKILLLLHTLRNKARTRSDGFQKFIKNEDSKKLKSDFIVYK